MSVNDPQWGKKNNNQGPPDLDELWRNLNKKLGGLFDRRGGGQGPDEPDMKQIGGGAILLGILALLVWLSSGFYIVDASQQGIVLTFGKYSETTNPGLRWRLPYPIQSHELVNLAQVRNVEIGFANKPQKLREKEALMLTDDENIIDIQFSVQYKLKDPNDYLFNNRLPEDAVLQVAESSLREVVGKSKIDFVLYEGREEVASKVHKLMQETLDRYKTGIQVSKINIRNAQAPEPVKAAFSDVQEAEQDRDRQIKEGQAYANDIVPKARGLAARLLQEAEGYRQREIANAEGNASRFKQVLTEYRKAPQVTRERLYLDTMQQIMSNTTKVMIDTKGGNNLLYLPLDKLMQMGAGAASIDSAAQPRSLQPEVSTSTTIDTPPRSRDVLRNRDRERP